MNGSRVLALTRVCRNVHKGLLLNKRAVDLGLRQQIRHSGHEMTYRCIKQNLNRNMTHAKIIIGIMWWWVLWHCFTEYEEVIGFTIPDPSKWTDEELGIPKD